MPGKGTLTIVSRQSAVGSQQSAVGSQQSGDAASHQPPVTTPRSLVIEITDSGIGMDQESLEKIFEPYFSTRAAGTGLGLTIAKRNVELNGGTIGVTSERGVGTTVTIVLPV